MGNRNSDSSYEGKIEDANFAVKIDHETLEQLLSTAEAAKAIRAKPTIKSPDTTTEKVPGQTDQPSKKGSQT